MSPRPRTIGELYAETTKDRPRGRSLSAFEIRAQAEAIRMSVAGKDRVPAAAVETLAGLVEDLAAIVHTLDTGLLSYRPGPVTPATLEPDERSRY